MDRQIRVKIIQMCSLCSPDHWARLSSPCFLSKLLDRFRPQVVHGTAAPLSLPRLSLSHASTARLRYCCCLRCCRGAEPARAAMSPRALRRRPSRCRCTPRAVRARATPLPPWPSWPRAAPPRSPRLPAPSHGRRGHGPSSPPPPATAATRHSRRRAELAMEPLPPASFLPKRPPSRVPYLPRKLIDQAAPSLTRRSAAAAT